MNEDLPIGKWGRALTGGQTVAKVGGRVLAYYAKRPFLTAEAKHRARERASRESAETLFKGLSLLKGTALKMAQQLSLEMDLLPEAACRELAKAYHQVPPINRALVRKVVQEGLGGSLESLFTSFDLKAHAAASLGQVHRAVGLDGRPLAVKIQYPGIAKTIDSDLALLRQMLRPMVQSDHLMPTLEEVAARLREEVDYEQEADNCAYFARVLNVDGVRIPAVLPAHTGPTVLTAAFMPGRPLDQWLQEKPNQEDRDRVADRLQAIFIEGLYQLGTVHADPNPGNFIIADDLTVGLVDFGCVKRLSPTFVDRYRRLARSAAHHEERAHFILMQELGLFSPELGRDTLKALEEISTAFSRWFGRLYIDSFFDFDQHPDFIQEGKQIMGRLQTLKRHLKVNTDFIFLDRTRYGLLRIFEQMGARVAFRNPHEWGP
ncbi:MAG: AarF/ABC1/UbiB kinase family protein [Desulfosarcinaceae bacterium]|jgi:predicted unusual protein kinase regulating ubiquinone biosynthesis (AarF/ABC1/UbiB family)